MTGSRNRFQMNALPDTPDRILKDVDYCLVTHLHFDHFCADYLPKDLRIITQNHEDAEKIRQLGFDNAIAFETEQDSKDFEPALFAFGSE